MSPSTTYDFYLGRGPDARWLGSARLDRCQCDYLAYLVDSVAADEYAWRVLDFVVRVDVDRSGTAYREGGGWPWPWPSSHGTDMTYAFDDGAVWGADHAQRWKTRAAWQVRPQPDETPLVLPAVGGYCRFTGLDAADTVARRYGPLLGDTCDLDLRQLAVRILADLTLPARPPAPGHEGGRWAAIPPHTPPRPCSRPCPPATAGPTPTADHLVSVCGSLSPTTTATPPTPTSETTASEPSSPAAPNPATTTRTDF
ncbi:hypothetical protein [Amycolatopsis sp. H20-H5]|uniref:hypothetical protein n=1 Tax=Amycolatopsis sp. H20-H5 TaxID=3046309 RepID=UPI002DB5F552|nr:hypothetical protein [Amycolatopsis sp. H20-H5]MEC3979915.1 hypothetical protein [Amycolatopsis sp. H20-H5]